MRILQIINDLRVGGAESLCTQLTSGLRTKGFEVQVLALRGVESPLSSTVRASGALLAAHIPSRPAPALWSISNIFAIQRQLAQFDIVHVHLFPAQLWTAFAITTLPRHERPILVTTEHSTFNRRRKVIFRNVDRAMYSAYNRIVAISSPTAAALAEWLRSSPSPITVIPNGIDYLRFASALTVARSSILPSEIADDSYLILCAGHLSEAKDQSTALRALTEIPAAHLCLAGTGELQPQLEMLAVQLGIRSRVHFLGRRDDMPQLMKAADVYVQPSRWEGFGLAVAEAMASGTPVICSNVMGMREVVGDAGICFPAGDSGALAGSVNSLRADEKRAAELRDKGKARAKLFTIDRYINRHVLLYKELVERDR